MAYPLTRTIK